MVCSEKNGLYDGTEHKAHNFNGEFCKFCAYGFEIIVFIFLAPEGNDSQNLKNKSNNISIKFRYVRNFIKQEIFSTIVFIPSFAPTALSISCAIGIFRHFIDAKIFPRRISRKETIIAVNISNPYDFRWLYKYLTANCFHPLIYPLDMPNYRQIFNSTPQYSTPF